MKFAGCCIATVFGAISLTGCYSHVEPEAFSPIITSFSNEYSFDPLRGRIKSFNQRMLNTEGSILTDISGELDEAGCVTSLRIYSPMRESLANLVKEGRYLVDAKTRSKSIRLDDNCNFLQSANGKIRYHLDDKHYLVSAVRMFDGKVVSTFKYNDEGLTLEAERGVEPIKSRVVVTPNKNPRTRLNYHSIVYLFDIPMSTWEQDCTYDDHANPLQCAAISTDISGKPENKKTYTIEYETLYY